jgi:hypothetical protein
VLSSYPSSGSLSGATARSASTPSCRRGHKRSLTASCGRGGRFTHNARTTSFRFLGHGRSLDASSSGHNGRLIHTSITGRRTVRSPAASFRRGHGRSLDASSSGHNGRLIHTLWHIAFLIVFHTKPPVFYLILSAQ